MSSLQNAKPRPAQYGENGYDSALRDGEVFIFDPLTVNIPALPANNILNLRFTTGDHAILFQSASFGVNQELVTFEVFQDAVYSDGGVLNSTYIRKANNLSNRETEIQVYTDPVITNDGERVLHDIIRGTAQQGQNKPGFGTGGGEGRIVLKPNTEHLFRITNGSALAVDVEPHISYREVNPKEYTVVV